MPSSYKTFNDRSANDYKLIVLTATDASRAATATISAHDTMPGQMLSTWDLASSMTSYPLIEPLLFIAFFSLDIEGASSSKIDASQPCNNWFIFIMLNLLMFVWKLKMIPRT